MHKVSFIIPVRNEEKTIRQCLDSLLNIDYPKDKIEILLAEGKSTDNTKKIIEKYASEHSNIKVFDNPTGNTATGRNICLIHATGDFIMNYSGHAIAEYDILKVLLPKFTSKDIGGVGYSNLTPNQNAIGNAVGVAFRGFMAGGSIGFNQNASFKTDRFVSHMPFVCYKKEVFDRIGNFDERFPSGQDVDFNIRMQKVGYKLLYTPDTKIYLAKPDRLRELWKKMYRYGKARVKLMKKHPDNISIFYIIPPSITICIIMIIILVYLSIFPLTLIILPSIFYFGLCLASSLQKSMNIKYALINLLVYPIIHFGYSIGMLSGILGGRND